MHWLAKLAQQWFGKGRKPRRRTVRLQVEELEPRITPAVNLSGWYTLATDASQWGQTISVDTQVRNSGSTASGAFSEQWYLSRDAVGSNDDVLLTRPNGLGTSYNHAGIARYSLGPYFTVSLQLPSSLPNGWTGTNFYIITKTDAFNQVAESNESDNFGQVGDTYDRDPITITGQSLPSKPVDDIIARDSSTGRWSVGVSTGSSFSTSVWTTWATGATWVNVQTGDFNGDGYQDLVGRASQTGQWWVSLSNGANGFTTALWDTWSTAVTWADVQVGDFNHDGLSDLVGRMQQNGQWWVAISNGTAFTHSLWAVWSPSVTWVDVRTGDLDGDGRTDIIGRTLQGGQWWAGLSTGSAFNTSLFATWSTAVTWVDVRLGDLNGDGRADIVGRTLQGGQWWAGLSTGSAFTTNLWASWSAAGPWVDVQIGDFNGDGRADITARFQGSGQWWTGLSTGSAFSTTLWATWSTKVSWVDVHAGFFAPEGKRSDFNITLTFSGLTASEIAIFNQAVARWQQVILSDLPDVYYGGQLVDDLLISASATYIDGPGAILGQAGPDALRNGSYLPYHGAMEFDSADLANMEANGQLYHVILHEMGHVLGIGTIWSYLGLLSGAGGSDPRFLGAQATAAYQQIFGTSATSVPVANVGMPGSRDSHWRESVFGDELMTPYIGTANPMSRVTVASLMDLGYSVDMNAADPYTPGSSIVAASQTPGGSGTPLFAAENAPDRSADFRPHSPTPSFVFANGVGSDMFPVEAKTTAPDLNDDRDPFSALLPIDRAGFTLVVDARLEVPSDTRPAETLGGTLSRPSDEVGSLVRKAKPALDWQGNLWGDITPDELDMFFASYSSYKRKTQ